MTLKSDIVLCGGAFLGAALLRPARRWALVGYAVVVVVGATLTSIGYAHLVVAPPVTPATGGLVTFLKNWNDSFAVSLDALLTDSNNTSISRCVGALLFSVIVLALCYGLVMGGALRKQALLAMLWGLPPILAWGVRFGNSARHSVPGFPGLILVTTIFLFEITRHHTWRASALISGLMFASYFSHTSGENSLKPQSNLIALSEVMSTFARTMHRHARVVAQTPGLKRALVAGRADPYTEFELFSGANEPKIEIGEHWVLTDGERTTVIDYDAYMAGKSPRALARKYRRSGYEAISSSYDL
jgi:hypothetical protein